VYYGINYDREKSVILQALEADASKLDHFEATKRILAVFKIVKPLRD
jgi:hypothetical protein